MASVCAFKASKEKWGKLTDDELDQIAGKREQLIGKLQMKYGIVKEEAEKQIREFEDELDRSSAKEFSSRTGKK